MGTQQLMMDSAVQMSINMTAKMFGMTPESVTKVLQAGLPAMGKLAQENPEVMKEMYGASLKMMPEDMQAMYAKMAEDPALQAATQEDYQKVFGEMTESVNRVAAEGAGVDEATAGKVLGASMPGVSKAMATDAPAEEDEKGFGHRVRGIFD